MNAELTAKLVQANRFMRRQPSVRERILVAKLAWLHQQLATLEARYPDDATADETAA